ncbi:MAG: hypothetical protein WCN88_04950 [Candidatus Falkowbacteria bacterium]
MGKKIKSTATTKLSKITPDQLFKSKNSIDGIEELGIITPKRTNKCTKTFRLNQDDIDNLKKITTAVNNKSRRQLSENKVVQALFKIGTKIPAKTLIKAFGEMFID